MTDQLDLFGARRPAPEPPPGSPDDGGESLAEARERVRKNLDEGMECPCCHQLAKRYKRTITSSMAHVLGLMARWQRDNTGWLHVPGFLSQKQIGVASRGGDFAKLVHWGLIEQQPGERNDGSWRSGYYRVTHRGMSFVNNEIRVPRHIYIYNQIAQDVPETESVSFPQTLGKGFDYWQLMYGKPKQEENAP